MNIKEYISSGILEAYVLGELTEIEMKEVESMAKAHPEIRESIQRAEETLEVMAFKTAIQPDASIKEALFAKLKTQSTETEINSDSQVKSLPKEVIQFKIPRFVRLLTAASISITIISSLIAYNYWQKWQNTVNELDQIIAQNTQIAQDYDLVNERLAHIENDLDIINNDNFVRIKMGGTDAAPNALTYVYWDKLSAEVYLSVQNLKALSNDHQYQLWAIIDGKPVDAGVFDTHQNALIQMKPIQGAVAYAITVEPKGGSISPTLETMQVYGEVVQI